MIERNDRVIGAGRYHGNIDVVVHVTFYRRAVYAFRKRKKKTEKSRKIVAGKEEGKKQKWKRETGETLLGNQMYPAYKANGNNWGKKKNQPTLSPGEPRLLNAPGTLISGDRPGS